MMQRSERCRAKIAERLILALGGVPVVYAPATALAAGGAAGPSTSEIIWQGTNLLLLVIVLVVVARKPIARFFAGRRERIQSELHDAGVLLEQAESRFGEWQRKLAQLDAELDEIRATATRRAEDERGHILAEARAAAERIKRDATAVVDQELRRARSELRQEASELALEVAGELLNEHVAEGDRDRLMDEFISRVEQSSALSGSGR